MRYSNFTPLISNEKKGNMQNAQALNNGNMQNAPALPCDTLSQDISGYKGTDKYGNCYNKCSKNCPSSDCSLECSRLIFTNMPTLQPATTPGQATVDNLIQQCKSKIDPSSNMCKEQLINCCAKQDDIVNKTSSGLDGTDNYSPSGMELCSNVADNYCVGKIPMTTFPPGVEPVCDTLTNNISTFTGPDKYTNCMTYCKNNCSPDYNCYKTCDPLLTQSLTVAPTTIQIRDVDIGIDKCLSKTNMLSNYCKQDFINCCIKDNNIVNYSGVGKPGNSDYIPSGIQKCYDTAENICINKNQVQLPTTGPPVTLPPVTLPPVTLPPVTLPPVTLPPVTLPPVTLAPELPQQTRELVKGAQQTTTSKPVKGQKSINIFKLIGFCLLGIIALVFFYFAIKEYLKKSKV